MMGFYLLIALLLFIDIIVGLLRVLYGPSAADRMLAAQLFGTTGVAILLLLAEVAASSPLRNVALVFALLAVLAMTAFVKHTGLHGEKRPEGFREGDA